MTSPSENQAIEITDEALPATGGATPVPAAPEFDLDGALARLRGRRALLVYMHDNPDPDSLAAALGLGRLLEHELGCTATIAVGGLVGRAENRAMVEVLDLPLRPLHELDPAQFDCLAVVDSQPGTGNNSLPPGRVPDIVVDHHPPRSELTAPWCDVREQFGATSTIVLQYLHQRGVPIDTRLATAFFYALRSETRDLGREATPAERAAYLFLVSRINHEWLDRISHPKVRREHFTSLHRALGSARVHDDIVAANLGELPYPDLVAEIADLLLTYEGARFALVAGHHHGRVYLSLRTDADFGRAGHTMRQVVGAEGSAGGHGTMAGGRLHALVASPADMQVIFGELVARLEVALGRTPTPGIALIG